MSDSFEEDSEIGSGSAGINILYRDDLITVQARTIPSRGGRVKGTTLVQPVKFIVKPDGMNGRVLNFNLSHEFTIDQFLGRAKNLDRSGLFVGVDNLIDRTAIGSGIIVGGHGTLVVSGTARGQSEE